MAGISTIKHLIRQQVLHWVNGLHQAWFWLLQILSQVDLFTRSFLLLSTLMLASLGAWVLVFFSLEMGPRAAQMSQRIATSVNLTLTTLTYAPSQDRRDLLRTLSLREGLDVYARTGLDVI
jgi:two-component system osmolarity sensor histidine kinase EnvZ